MARKEVQSGQNMGGGTLFRQGQVLWSKDYSTCWGHVENRICIRSKAHISYKAFFLPCGTPEDYNLLKFLLVPTENGFFHDTSFLAISVTSVAVANAAQRRKGCFWLAVYGDTGYCGGRQFPATWSVTLLAHLSANPEAVKGPDLSSFLISPLPRCQGPQPQALDGTAHR